MSQYRLKKEKAAMPDLDELERMMAAAIHELATEPRCRVKHLDWVLAIQDAAPALISELRALRAFAKAQEARDV
jgi:hypothetical protein